MNFYGKTFSTTKTQSRLFSSFSIPKEKSELSWHSFTVQLPENLTMVKIDYV